MLDPTIFTELPLASANAVFTRSVLKRFGMYLDPAASPCADVIASRVENYQSASVWRGLATRAVSLFEPGRKASEAE